MASAYRSANPAYSPASSAWFNGASRFSQVGVGQGRVAQHRRRAAAPVRRPPASPVRLSRRGFRCRPGQVRHRRAPGRRSRCRGRSRHGEHRATGPFRPWRDVGVEPDLPLVEAHRQAGLTAHRIAGGDLQHHRLRPGRSVRVAQGDPVALAHLPGADAFVAERGDRAGVEHLGQPVFGQVRGAFDHDVTGVGLHPTNL